VSSIAFPIPVPCRDCGTYFTLDQFRVGDEASISLEGCATKCPNCGCGVAIPSGTYKASKELGGILFSSTLSRESAQVLIRYLQEVRGKDIAPEEVAEKLAEKIPGANKAHILELLNKRGAFAFVGWMLAVLLWYEGPRSKGSGSADRPVPALVQPNVKRPEVVTPHRKHKHHANKHRHKDHAKPHSAPSVDRKLKPEQWCDCRSGKKAKNCHPERCE
jgi:hypothetical protein